MTHDLLSSLTADVPSHSADMAASNLAQLKALFPDVVTEGPQGPAVNVEALRELVGEKVLAPGEGRYGLDWHGKRTARQLALTPSAGTLRPVAAQSVEGDTSANLMIEGDNLEVLKLLQRSYAGQVKLIYIDPPYNTGKDFVYPDNFQDSIGHYQALTGQVHNGVPLSSNVETSGRFHTDWLNMMYPRLKLAHALLEPDGVIFVSIDQGEVGNLRLLLDEIFGEENFVNQFSWVRTRTPAALSQKTKNVVEYVLCYERSRTAQPLLGIEKTAQSANTLLNQPNAVGVLEFPAGLETGMADGTLVPGTYGSSSYGVELLDRVQVRDGRFQSPFRLQARFRWSQAYLDAQLASGTRVRIASNKLLPSYEKDGYGREALPNLIDDTVGVGTNELAGAELETLMGARVFSYPKPLSLLRYLVNSCTSGDDLVLDFFAGSGTTGHAVMQQNAADGGQRRFLLVQLPEPLAAGSAEAEYCSKHGLPATISALTRERLRRASLEVASPNPALRGFKAFALDSSNLRAWDPYTPDLAQALLDSVDNVLPGRSHLDLLHEVLLKLGIALTAPIAQRAVGTVQVYSVADGQLMACLGERITADAVEPLAAALIGWRNEQAPGTHPPVVCVDTTFADDLCKANLAQALRQAGLHLNAV